MYAAQPDENVRSEPCVAEAQTQDDLHTLRQKKAGPESSMVRLSRMGSGCLPLRPCSFVDAKIALARVAHNSLEV
jgi:hypothetical protein